MPAFGGDTDKSKLHARKVRTDEMQGMLFVFPFDIKEYKD
jgi:hypothetical protein